MVLSLLTYVCNNCLSSIWSRYFCLFWWRREFWLVCLNTSVQYSVRPLNHTRWVAPILQVFQSLKTQKWPFQASSIFIESELGMASAGWRITTALYTQGQVCFLLEFTFQLSLYSWLWASPTLFQPWKIVSKSALRLNLRGWLEMGSLVRCKDRCCHLTQSKRLSNLLPEWPITTKVIAHSLKE